MELYKSLSNTFITHIPYRGSGPALNDAVAGQVPTIFDNMPSALPFIKDGRLVPIVVAAPQRLAALPNVPAFKEVGLEPVNRMAYYGILGPKNLPKEVIDKIHAGVMKALQDPAVRKRIEDTGSLIVGNTPQQFTERIKARRHTAVAQASRRRAAVDGALHHGGGSPLSGRHARVVGPGHAAVAAVRLAGECAGAVERR